MFVELHILQNFAPSNLNRDDSNTPKDCVFGGFRRARVSSQCIKRAVRRHPVFAETVEKAGGDMGVRTKRLKGKLAEILVGQYGKGEDEAQQTAHSVIEMLGLAFKGEDKTQYLLYFGDSEIMELARIAGEFQGEIATTSADGEGDAPKDAKAAKKKNKGKVASDDMKKLQAALQEVVGKKRREARAYAADIALFGRMIADGKDMNVDAACQVAHALSTHKVEMEMDYFTAVDDLLPDEESGSDMIGIVEFNSACFYRYSAVDLKKLRENLGSNDDLLAAVVQGYVEASIKAVPTGKQNSMAAQNPVGYARVVVRKDGFPWSLTNAFQKPVRANAETSLEERSIEKLEEYFVKLKDVYGAEGIAWDGSFNLYGEGTLAGLLNGLTNCLEQEKESLR